MRPCARVILALLPAVLSFAHVHAGTDYGSPMEIKLWDTGRTPLSHMVDVTNEFGLKVLAEHNFLNDNNIVFSPYGLMGILVALYEGVDGESSYQIQQGMQLPWNRNIMRVGFRDIHRTLKTYFIPEEGFLAGLALNNDNVTFNENYKKVLRFYGFDLENDQLPSFPARNGTNETSTSSNGEDVVSTVTSSPSTEGREETVPAREEITINPNAETFNDIDTRMPTAAPTTANIGNINVFSITDTLFTRKDVTPANNVHSTVSAMETTSSAVTTETLKSIAVENTSPTMVMTFPTESITTIINTPSMAASPTSDGNEEVQALSISNQVLTTSTSSSDISTAPIASDSTDSTSLPLITFTAQFAETGSTELSTTTNDDTLSVTDTSESTIEPLERRKKSIVNFIFTSPPYIGDNPLYRGFDIPVSMPHDPNLGDDQMFLAYGLKSVQVSYMQYDAVLEHAQLAHLQAAALRLPLDSERYYLLALLPARADAAALPRLLARLARHSDLRDVYAALRPKRVKARIPSFTVKGHVILTADLQKLGIRDVFEPRQRDFSPMTPQPGVYVRSVEQAVSVALRNYHSDDRNNSRYTNRPPVHFSATYPFLYFVMDASIHVALMAGKMVDPLNSRIL